MLDEKEKGGNEVITSYLPYSTWWKGRKEEIQGENEASGSYLP